MKYKSYAFWTGLAAAVVILANSIAKALGISFDSHIISDIIMAVCGLLVVLGIVNMPVDSTAKELTDENLEDDENLSSDKNDKDKDIL